MSGAIHPPSWKTPHAMTVVAIGCNHRSAPLDVLERVAVAADDLPKVLHEVCSGNHVSEAVVLSTCNRTEVYCKAERFHDAYQEVRDALAVAAGLAPETLAEHLYVHFDDEAVRHLFAVTAGLDSAVLGEHEILGQVRTAWETAMGEGASRSALNLLFRSAVGAGKRARTETDIGRHSASVSQVAVEVAHERLGLDGRRVLLLGAGEIGSAVARALTRFPGAQVVVANRTLARAATLAAELGAEAVELDRLAHELVQADVVLGATGSPGPLVTHDQVAVAMACRPERPLLLVDVARPRDVEPAAADVAGAQLVDLDELQLIANRGLERRAAEISAVEAVLDEERQRYRVATSAQQVSPLIGSLHRWAEAVRRNELERFGTRLDRLDPAERELVADLSAALVAKLLHEPTVRLKQASGTPRGDRLADALRELFEL
jgi:glutamyl-tRNA reductase